jgi:hypothetical protein
MAAFKPSFDAVISKLLPIPFIDRKLGFEPKKLKLGEH